MLFCSLHIDPGKDYLYFFCGMTVPLPREHIDPGED